MVAILEVWETGETRIAEGRDPVPSGNSIARFAAIFSIGAIFGLILGREKREISKNGELGLDQVSGAEQHDPANGIPSSLTPEKNPQASHDDHSQPQKTKHTLLEKAAVAMAVVAVAATIWQGWIALDTEERSLRAYLGVISTTMLQCPDCANALYKDPESGSGLHISPDFIVFTVKAGGQTPAYDVHLRHIDWEPFRIDIPYQFGIPFIVHSDFAKTIESRTTILPGETQQFQAGIQVAPFRAAKFDGAGLRVYGGFDYFDIFDRQWTKDFCVIYRGSYTQDTFTACPEHNGEHVSQPTSSSPHKRHI